MLNIVGHKKTFFAISGVLIAASIVAIVLLGFEEGIDFKGGTLWQFSIQKTAVAENAVNIGATLDDLKKILNTDLGVNDVILNYDSANNLFLTRFPVVSEADHQRFLEALKNKYSEFEEQSFQSIGPSVGNALRKKAIIAVVLVLIGISLYIAFAFRKISRPISSWKYGWVTLLTLFHDVIIPTGLVVVLGHFLDVEIDANFVVALLVVMGFSVHDTIVVFDRIRENLTLDRGRTKFETVINDSVNRTLARSVNTSLTLILVLIALYFFGPLALRYFVLTLLVGVTTGIYSSIFIASPLLIVISPKERK